MKIGKVDFAIITILQEECEAIEARFNPVPYTNPSNQQTYGISHVQTRGGKNCTVAIARTSRQGNDASQQLANRIINDLDPQMLLVVGIGGGVPDTDFTLGDVIVSSYIHNFNVTAIKGDKINYDVTGGIHPKISDITASLFLYRSLLADWNSEASISVPRPRLYLTEKRLLDLINKDVDEIWREKVAKALKWHFDKTQRGARAPIFLTGTIASSNTLVRSDAALAQWLQDARSIRAVEMEVAGVYQAAQQIRQQYPVMAIRGISDIVGFKRDDTWKLYACHTAAAFAHAFITADIVESATNLPVLGTTLYAYDIHSKWVSIVAWSSDGMRLASSSGDGTVRVWDAATGDNILTYRGHSTPGLLSDLGSQSPVYAVSWSPDGRYIASGGPGTSVHVWDAATGNNILTYRNHSGFSGIFALAWSPDGKYIASSCGGMDKKIQVSDATTGESTLAYKGHFNRLHVLTRMTIVLTVGALAWSPDSKRIASGGDDKRVHVWDATTGDSIFTYRDHSNQISSVAWSPDGIYIASAGYNEKTVRIWNATTGDNISIYLGHSSTVRKVAWSPNGKLIASASNDKTVHLWEPTTRRHIFTYKGHSDKVTTVAWSPDGTRIASGSNDGIVQVWAAIAPIMG